MQKLYLTRETLYGLIAILIWSTTIAFPRSLSEQVGALRGGATIFMISGFVCLAWFFRQGRGWARLRRFHTTYLYGCGGLFILYMLALYIAIGLCRDRYQALEIGLINYLWPSCTILFSLLLLRKKGSWLLWPGTLLALLGVILAMTQSTRVSVSSFIGNVLGNPWAYFLALVAALSWGLYSNLARRWSTPESGNGAVLFIPATGLVLLLIAFWSPAPGAWTLRAVLEAFFVGLATMIAYILWDLAMRKGDMVFVAACSYFTPFFSTLFSCFYLRITPAPVLWAGCGLIIAGSLLSWIAVADEPPQKPRRNGFGNERSANP
jgi:drug/metabolite transporter (DMT)-like permease